MNVSVQVDLSAAVGEKHLAEMGSAANLLTDDRDSVRVSVLPDNSKSMLAEFTIPKARQMDVVDKIMREFAMFMEDYADQTVWFPKKPKQRRSRKAQPESGHVRR